MTDGICVQAVYRTAKARDHLAHSHKVAIQDGGDRILISRSQVFDDLIDTKEIGKGAYSKVYKGFDITTDQLVAIKVISKRDIKPIMLNRIKKEIEILSDIQHENIIKLYEHIETDEHFYLILEYCSGGDLYDLMAQHRIPEFRAKIYVGQLAEGLFYLRCLKHSLCK